MTEREATAGTRGETKVLVFRGGETESAADEVAVEAALTIRLAAGDGPATIAAVTMRTPGRDGDLAIGYLFAEGVVRGPADLARSGAVDEGDDCVVVRLPAGAAPPLAVLDRRSVVSSACGACGKTSVENLVETARRGGAAGRPGEPRLDPAVLAALPDRMRAAQSGFAATGGLHAAARFDLAGNLLDLAEDVGRHNALDKVIGRAVREGRTPLAAEILLVSGRASFELVQKAAAAGAPLLAAVSAPSSLAVETARRAGVTLVAFLRGDSFNVYAGSERLDSSGAAR